MSFNDFFKSQIEPIYASSIDPQRLQQARQYQWQFLWMFLGVSAFALLAGWYFDSRTMAFKVFALSFMLAQFFYMKDYPYPDHEKPGYFLYFITILISAIGFFFVYHGWISVQQNSNAAMFAGSIALLLSLAFTLVQSPERAALKRPLESLQGEVLDLFLKQFFPKMYFVSAQVADSRFLGNSRIFNFNFNQMEYGTALEGQWGDHTLIIQKVILQEKTKTKSGESVSTKFRGFITLINRGHSLSAPLIIRPHRGAQLADIFVVESDRIEMEDPVFEKIYDVVATNEFEARRLVTPSFMSQITKLSTGEAPFYGAYFDQSRTLLPIETDCPFFEANYADIDAVKEELSQILDVLDQVLDIATTTLKM